MMSAALYDTQRQKCDRQAARRLPLLILRAYSWIRQGKAPKPHDHLRLLLMMTIIVFQLLNHVFGFTKGYSLSRNDNASRFIFKRVFLFVIASWVPLSVGIIVTPPPPLIFTGNIASGGRPRTADQLAVPECASNADCVVGGVCIQDRDNKGRCFCSSSCPLNVPVQCMEDNEQSCVTMGDAYTSKYDMRAPLCYQKRCICPPAFDSNLLQPPIPGFKATLPMKCDRRELQAMIVTSPSDSVYRGTAATLFCCVNVDPRDFIPMNGVYFIQNGTRKREPTTTPYDNFSPDIDTLFTVPTCWSLQINNVQLSDSGSYLCIVQPLSPAYRTMNVSLEFVVKIPSSVNARKRWSRRNVMIMQPSTSLNEVPARPLEGPTPRMIQNVTITPNATSALVTWDTEDGPMLKIDLELYRRSDRKTKVWHKENVKSPVLIEHLASATPYTLFITVVDGQTEPFRLTEQFQSSDGIPDAPQLEDIRLINAENGKGQMCEIEWRPPRRARGHVTRYYVQMSGKLRYVAPEGRVLSADDYPPGVDICSNYNSENSDKYINPNLFQRFFACKYGPLKPNRNYTATIWAENGAGRSRPVAFKEQCVMDFAQPDYIAPPQTLPRTNMSSFALEFTGEPDETNGPIVCYYLAIVPLPSNVSVTNLPSTELIVMDTFDKALQNNLHQSATVNSRFFAYIAESYMQYPKRTIIGDGSTSGGVEPCNVLYLARYKPLDSALTPNLKYTGFLIARVDRDRSLQLSGAADSALSSRSAAITGFGTIYSQATRRSRRSDETTHFIISPSSFIDSSTNRQQRQRISTSRRQLSNIDPAYGFSDYFKPVILTEHDDDGSALEIFLIILFLLMFIALSSASLLYFLYKKGMIKEMCPKQKNHDLLRPGAPPKPITVDDLPEEYILRHRDSDYQFTQEFEMLPRGKNLSHTVSERNARKNRYNDIKACDATRVCLRKIPGDNGSDYINANFIKGYHNQKTFIASQGPLEHTVGDFWRMIWEQGCKIIIMVTNLRERGREQCAKYWPEEADEPLRVRNFSIRAVESIYYADYAVREFELCDADSPPTTLGGGNISSTNGGAKLASSVVGLNSIDCRVSPTFYSTADDSKHPAATGNCGVATTNGGIGSGVSSMLKNSSIMSWSSSALKESDQAESFTSSRMDSDYANVSSIIRSNSKNSNHQTAETDFIKERRRVVQYHFTSWNDYKAPECTMSLLRLICRLRKLDEYNNSPVVVHCSAGVGRTGTLIAIDYVMDQCEAEGRADVFNCVAELRQQRNLMVQSVEQYVFIYKALAEFQLFGNTDMTIAEFTAFYNGRLRQPVYSSKERERHFSVGSSRSSARSNSIIGAQSVLGSGGGGGVAILSSEAEKFTPPPPATTSTTTVTTTTTKEHSTGSGGGALVDHGLTSAMAISAGLRARLKQLRNGLSGGGTGPPASTAPSGCGASTTQSAGGGSIAAMVGSGSTKPTHLEAEFMNLSISLEKTRPFDWSKKPENVTRNRFPDVVPYNVNRVILAPLIGYDNTYINASIVKGYFYPYILAQDPLDAETVFDFWRMIHDNNSYTLVMLSTEADFNRSEKYWPEDTEKKLILGKNGELVVTMLQQHEIPPICLFRRLHYRFKTDKNSAGREVVQFAFRQWKSGQPVPSFASALLELIGRVLERQSNIPDAGPIILHCRNGSSENGVFCCLSLLLERLKSEQMVDIFRTVKSLQLQRPLLFTKLEQYAFCYDCVTEYINSSQ